LSFKDKTSDAEVEMLKLKRPSLKSMLHPMPSVNFCSTPDHG
jgi:hypothetical protein